MKPSKPAGMLLLAALLGTSCADKFVDVTVTNQCGQAVEVAAAWDPPEPNELERLDRLVRHPIDSGSVAELKSVLATSPWDDLQDGTVIVWPERGEMFTVAATPESDDGLVATIPASACEP